MVRKARLAVRRQEVDQVMNDQQHLLWRGLFRSARQETLRHARANSLVAEKSDGVENGRIIKSY